MKKDRRKAIDAKLIGESKTSPGYFKYQFTILELDGTTQILPAYGKDMEDALERLVWVERTEKKPFNIMVISALLTVIIIPSIIAALTNNPIWVLGALALAITYGFVMVRLDKYFNKK
jgi:hypothetical protein